MFQSSDLNWLSGHHGHASVVLSALDYVNVGRDGVDRNFIVHVWWVEHTLKIVLNHSISKKNCFTVSNAHLLTIYARNWRFRLSTDQIA